MKQEVVIKDVQMEFSSMVWFMVKWALATIPAMIILGVPMFIAFVILVFLI